MVKNYTRKSTGVYHVLKCRDYKQEFYGCYPTEKTAQRIVSELKAVDWDKSKLQGIRDKLRNEGVEL